MNKFKKEIAEDLLDILDKVANWKLKNEDQIPDQALLHISYALEHLTGEFGVTDEHVKKWDPDYFRNKNN